MPNASTSEPLEELDEDDFIDRFVDTLRQKTAKAGLPAYYVVPLSDVSSDSDDEDTDCLVVMLPVDKRAIKFKSDYLCGQVRVTPDGIHVGCLLLADGKVPVSELVFYDMELGERDKINVLWVFTDGHYLLAYDYTDDLRDSMAKASHIADAMNDPPKPDHASVFEVFTISTQNL
ncbi:hypothetical protein [Paraburkholderia terrae]|uniref:Uncharacterized protein n=1 Tax=Paraburkholderia terrae TaxID=311230 RepID=A0A2I8F0Q4_9BURK|nr:hypothetical protein [Paraburkholderia terrae]AUT65071.1 hypothetical protein C2L65_36445 [Paraburkholderia terrae]